MGVMGAGGVVLFSPPRIMIINSSSRLLPRCHAPTLAARLGSVTSQSVSQSVISRSRPALTPPPARSPAPPLPVEHKYRVLAPGGYSIVTSQTGQLFLGPTPRPRSLDPPASRHRLRRSAPGQSSDDTETGLIRESVARASPTLRRSECVLLCYASRQETDGPRFSH